MRADVKLGVVVSAGMVLVAGGYYLWRSPSDAPIGLADAAPSATQTGDPAITTQGDNKRPTPSTATPSRRNTPRDRSAANAPRGAATPNRPVREASPGANVPTSQPNAGHAVSGRDATQSEPPIARQSSARQPSSNPASRSNPPGRDPATSPLASHDSDASADRRNDPGVVTTTAPARSNDTPPIEQPAPERTDDRPAQPSSTPALATRSAPVDAGPLRTSRTLSAESQPVATPGSAEAAMETHVIQPGDSFAALARKYYGSERFTDLIVKSNPQVADPSRLRIGATVRIPPQPDDSAAESPATTGRNMKTRVQFSSKTDGPSASRDRTYRVREGDSFYAIAREQLGDASRWTELLELNKALVNGDPTSLRVGQDISLPAK